MVCINGSGKARSGFRARNWSLGLSEELFQGKELAGSGPSKVGFRMLDSSVGSGPSKVGFRMLLGGTKMIEMELFLTGRQLTYSTTKM